MSEFEYQGTTPQTLRVFMDNEELLIASHVRDLAVKVRNDKWVSVYDGLKLSDATAENRVERDRIEIEWFSQNPIEEFVAEAYKLLYDVAIQIRSLQLINQPLLEGGAVAAPELIGHR